MQVPVKDLFLPHSGSPLSMTTMNVIDLIVQNSGFIHPVE
jgi:hypothetical protein